jgi:hypothetical protein
MLWRNTIPKAKAMSNMDPIENPGWNQVLAKNWSEQVIHKYFSRSLLSHICSCYFSLLLRGSCTILASTDEKQSTICTHCNIAYQTGALITTMLPLEFDLTDTNNSANNASHHVLYPEKLTVRVVWERKIDGVHFPIVNIPLRDAYP